MRFLRYIITGVLLLTAACGFHLRGNVDLPPIMKSTYIDAKFPFAEMTRVIDSELRSAGATVVTDADAATAVLRLIAHRSDRRILSVGSSGKATEYELFEEISFSVQDAEGRILLQPQTLRLTQDFVFDETQLLGKVEEAQAIHRQMQHALARRMMTRIQIGLGN